MAVGRRKSRERREPAFDAAPARTRELRVDPRDRPGAIDHDEPTSQARPAPGPRGGRGAGEKDGERGRSRPEAEPRDQAPRKRKTGGRGGGRHKRSLLGRLVYWALVLGIWAVIGVIGIIAWTAAHLPPIQSLEVPKRPPSIQI